MKEPLIKANRVFKYSITFQETNEESREVSDFSDSGFIIENETDEIGDILKLAQQTYGIYYPISFGAWESTTPEQNAKYFEKGIETYYALFIENEDGTAITEEEYDFITFLLSDGNYNKSEFTDYAVGGVVLGALALGVGGLIAYYYFNKRKKGYPTGSAWTKEHYHDNEDEDYEVEPSKRKVPARNRKYVNGGGVDGGIANENLIVYFESGKGESFIYRITKLNGEELYASWLGSSATKEIIELKYKLESKYSKFIFNNDHSDSRYYGVIVINDGKVEEYNTNTDKWLNKKRELGLEKFVNGGKTEAVYIEFLNKEKGYKKDVKHFNSYEEAVEWARKNFDKFDYDMIKYKYDNGGGVGDKIDLLKDELEKLGIYVEKSLDIEKIPYLRIFPTNEPDVIENFFFINKQGKYEMGNNYYFGESEKAYVFDNRKQIVDFVKSEKFETIKERELKEQKRQSEKEEWLSPLQRLKKNRYVDGGGVEDEVRGFKVGDYFYETPSEIGKNRFYKITSIDKFYIKADDYTYEVNKDTHLIADKIRKGYGGVSSWTRGDFEYKVDTKQLSRYNKGDLYGYSKGGEIEVVGKGNKGAFRKREYEGMTEKEVIQWWEQRGYKLSKTKSESSLKPYTFYINKFVNGGGVSKEHLIYHSENKQKVQEYLKNKKYREQYREDFDDIFDLKIIEVPYKTFTDYRVIATKKYSDGGGVDDYDYEDIGQFSMPDSEWKNYSQEDFNRIGRKIVKEQFNGDLTRAYDSIVHKRTYFVVSAKNDKVVSRGFNTEEEAKKEMYSMFEKTGDFSYAIKKFVNGGTTTTRPTTTPEVVPDTDTKPRKPKTPYTPKHTPLIKPKARKYDFILIKK